MRSKISKVDKERLIRSFESGQDFIRLAQLLSINENTARTIIRRHRFKLHQNAHGGHKPRLITDIYGQTLIDFVSENCLATLKDMQTFLEAEGLKASQSAISQFLDGQFITLKRSRIVTNERNSERVKEDILGD